MTCFLAYVEQKPAPGPDPGSGAEVVYLPAVFAPIYRRLRRPFDKLRKVEAQDGFAQCEGMHVWCAGRRVGRGVGQGNGIRCSRLVCILRLPHIVTRKPLWLIKYGRSNNSFMSKNLVEYCRINSYVYTVTATNNNGSPALMTPPSFTGDAAHNASHVGVNLVLHLHGLHDGHAVVPVRDCVAPLASRRWTDHGALQGRTATGALRLRAARQSGASAVELRPGFRDSRPAGKEAAQLGRRHRPSGTSGHGCGIGDGVRRGDVHRDGRLVRKRRARRARSSMNPV